MSMPEATSLRAGVIISLAVLLVWSSAGRPGLARAQSPQAPSAQSGLPANTSPPAGAPPTQSPAAQQSAEPAADAPEMAAHDAPVPLQTRVSLVPVRVVVRDSEGHVVANLEKDDFQVFEDGKPQTISNFAVEALPSPTQRAAVPQTASSAATPAQPAAPAFLPPARFVALLFDDPHLNLQDLMEARIAAGHYLDASVTPTDRVAVFTVSGLGQLDFTDDRAKLHATLLKLLPREVTAGTDQALIAECPPMDYYEANLIQNQHDSQAIDIATQDALACLESQSASPTAGPGSGQQSPGDIARAQGLVTATALRVEEIGDQQTIASFRRLQEIVRRMSALPGQRSIVLISPGFIYPNREFDFSQIVDSAIRSSVFINSLDARGLYVPEIGNDISQQTVDYNPAAAGFRTSWHLTGQYQQMDVLNYLASDTGGYSFHNNNDLGEGLRQVAAAPTAYYFLAFVPQNLKYDGKLHSLKVVVRTKQKYSIQARRGYYAPLHGSTAVDVAKEDIEDALFSQEEQHGLPIGLQTQYYTDATGVKLSVLAHVDLAHVHFDKADGRNQDDLTVVAALFDRNGNFVAGTQRIVQMKLRDETLQKLSRTGVTVRTNFDVKPGDYVVRLVVRDARSALLSAENGVVEIPY
jgi:VWFA-related protein